MLWVENYKQKFRPENNEPRFSADMQPIRKDHTPTVNNQEKVRKPQAHPERNTQNPKPVDNPSLAKW